MEVVMKNKLSKKIILTIIVTALSICSFHIGTLFPTIESNAAVSSLFSTKEKKFTNPNDAIQYFVEQIAANDFSGALSACAVKQMSNYDLNLAAKNSGALVPPRAWSGKYNMYQNFNEIYFSNEITTQVKGMIWSLLLPSEEFNSPITVNSTNSKKYVEGLDPTKLSTLKIERIEKDYISKDVKQKMEEKNKERAQLYNADDSMECAVLYSWNGSYYYGGFSLLKVNGGWKIINLSAPYFGNDSSGLLTKTTVKEFEKRIAN